MMEHIHQKLKGIDFLSRLEKVHKIQAGSNSEAVGIASFEVMVPRFFTKSGKHEVYKDKESYFSNIKSYKKWDNPASGHKVTLELQIQRFHVQHLSVIRKKFPSTLHMYHVAVASLGFTIAWDAKLFAYIDKTYKSYAVGKFGKEKAWHVTMKLATGISQVVGIPYSQLVVGILFRHSKTQPRSSFAPILS